MVLYAHGYNTEGGASTINTAEDIARIKLFTSLSLLPLTLTLTDYSRTEKISDLPKKLSTKDAPAGYKAPVGDITIYAPWGNLAIFYKDFLFQMA